MGGFKAKILVVLALILGLSGCDNLVSSIKEEFFRYREVVEGYLGPAEPYDICYEGVTYVQFNSGSSVAYNKDGSIKLCKKKFRLYR